MSETPPPSIPDERLRLMFACAHPAVEPAVQAPLMLQAVLGLDAAAIASCFLTSPAAMGQRLVRAKARIRDSGPAFVLPEPADMPDRLDAVLAAIYAAYGTGWEDVTLTDSRHKGLSDEAIWLARVVVAQLPESAEALGLLALTLYCEARRAARRDSRGRFVPLADQDTTLWDRALIAEAEAVLSAAGQMQAPGRFQIEAAIQSVHVQRAATGATNWPALVALYGFLATLSPALGVRVGQAAVLAEAGEPDEALALLDGLAERGRSYQPWWAARGLTLQRLGRRTEARDAYAAAAGLTEDAAVRAHLLTRIRPDA